MFPVLSIDSLGQCVEALECGRLADVRDLVLDAVRHPVIEDVVECTWTVTTDLTGQAVKLNNILADMLAILHRKVVQLVLCISDRIVQAEVGSEIINEHHMIIHP